MPKIYQEKPKSEELFLRLRGDGFDDAVLLRIVTDEGQNHADGVLCKLTSRGIFLPGGVSAGVAARAGFSPDAIDANGRLKVIGQEVEAEEMQAHSYESEDASSHNALTVIARTDGNVVFGMRSEIGFAVAAISPKNLRDLRDHINRHLAYVEKEGLE